MKLTRKGYTGNYELEDGIYFGSVDLEKDAITFQSKDESKIQQEFEDSVDEYLTFCSEHRVDPQPPRRTS